MDKVVSRKVGRKWRIAATFLGVGYFPVAPATACALAVTAVVWVSGILDSIFYVPLVLVVIALGVAASSVAEREFGHDGSPIVIDEVAGQMIAFIAMPPTASTFIVGFFLFRFFDILKPFPINRSQRLVSGVGVMADDVMAGIYANLALRIIMGLAS